MSKWTVDRLDSYFTLKRGYDLPNQRRVPGNFPIISSSGIAGWHIDAMREGPGVVTGRYGTIGEVFFSVGPYWPLNTTLYVSDFKGNVERFVYYFLKNFDFERFNDKSAVPGVNRNHIHEALISFPDRQTQEAITEVLSSLDDKIDLLQRQNQTLEQLAETLFRQWFVVGEGEDWTVSTIGAFLTIKGGTTPSTNDPLLWDGGIAWTSPKDLSGSNSVFMRKTGRTITERGLAKIGSGLLPVRTVLLSSRAPIGYLAITEIPVAINQGYIACVCDKGLSPWFTYLWLKQNMDVIVNAANGSTFLEISKSTFRELEFTVPPDNRLRRFDDEVELLFNKIALNEKQIETLQNLRDTLLPKLMSGEVKVSTAKNELLPV